MNSYIFLTDEGYTFQPETADDPIVIDSLETIGTAKGKDAMDAYRNLLAENPKLAERRFEKIFCYQVDEPVKENGISIN